MDGRWTEWRDVIGDDAVEDDNFDVIRFVNIYTPGVTMTITTTKTAIINSIALGRTERVFVKRLLLLYFFFLNEIPRRRYRFCSAFNKHNNRKPLNRSRPILISTMTRFRRARARANNIK